MKWRLVAAFMAVTCLVVVVQDVPLGNYLQRVERDRIVTALERDAFLLAGRSEDSLEAASPDPRVVVDVHRYRQASGARVVIVNAAGDAVVTSDDDQSATGGSYRSRPEIATALSGDIAAGQRHSVSLGTDLFYVAVPIVSGDRVLGAVRLTYPTQVVTDKVRGQLRILWLVAGVTVALAGAVAFLMATHRHASPAAAARAPPNCLPTDGSTREPQSRAGHRRSAASHGRLTKWLIGSKISYASSAHSPATPPTSCAHR